MKQFDILIIGSGTAGASAAYHLKKKGFNITVLEARNERLAGSNWVNGCPAWMYERAGFEQPHFPELRSFDTTFSFRSPLNGKELFSMNTGIAEIDMRELSTRLIKLNRDLGSMLFFKSPVKSIRYFDDHNEVDFTKDGINHTLQAKLIVDASGYSCVSSQFNNYLDHYDPRDLCEAAQQVRSIKDLDAAKNFLKSINANPNEVICTLGMQGGYSTFNICIDDSFKHVEFLAGSLKGSDFKPGHQMILDFLKEHPWVGGLEFGGRGVIPLKEIGQPLINKRTLLLGNAAGYVFPLHGSGTGAGLIAGKILSESLTINNDPGNPSQLKQFAHNYRKEFGAICASYYCVKKASESYSKELTHKLFASGLMSKQQILSGFLEEFPNPTIPEALQQFLTILRNPLLSLKMFPMVVCVIWQFLKNKIL